ncbi:MAG: Beta-lactamase [bacterium]|nr:MAG: Beta-lactamase [bacterium]
MVAIFIVTCAFFVQANNRWEEKKSWEKFFSQVKINGSFLLYDLNQNKYYSYNSQRVKAKYVPASTFKIFNSLVLLDTGVVKDVDEVVKWDGVDRKLPDWNRDQSMREAIRTSTVWFYQRLARDIGQSKMQTYINRAGYGNRNIDGGIDHFWLDGKLKISSLEQVQFLIRLHRNQLPFAQKNLDLVKDLLIEEKTEAYILRGKTGWAGATDPENGQWVGFVKNESQIGWWIGYIERKEGAFFFAINIDIQKQEDAGARKAVAKEILREMKVID